MAESPVHIKMNYDESVSTKKDFLISQMDLIKIRSAIKKYKLLRENELKEKEKLRKNMNDATLLIKKLQESLPRSQVPKIHNNLKENLKLETYTPKDKKKTEQQNLYDSFEVELKEIQERLKALG